MADEGERPSSVGPQDEIRTVLEAEERARDAVAAARAEAESLLEAARGEARRIGARADQRIQRLHQGSGEALARRLEALKAEEQERSRRLELGRPDAARIEAAAARVAWRLIGREPEPGERT